MGSIYAISSELREQHFRVDLILGTSQGDNVHFRLLIPFRPHSTIFEDAKLTALLGEPLYLEINSLLVKFLLPGLLLLLFGACLNDPECLVTATTEVKISFLKGKADSLLNIDMVTASGTDSIFYENDSTAHLTLPINPRKSISTFKIHHNGQIDSLQVGYVAQNLIISPSCGAFINYINLTVNASSFANVHVVTNQLSTSVKSNIEVKF